ncbi:SusC/RagA family TonB-linked outer membrane protein [Elizabethkingia meningoseptica]|uniref:SusC/RagA family TonB-linked outer membrane protein n=1 Tax=Elizabethkingia meningoseptica TaxID=238 RepID=UPI0023B1245A|nr:SusC/RagA family TonB-linked outer membrane protein [Elizabethkingia meningoseptica]MDE5469413.1 SusC/RagA family TonB-linked outer membrane protein [Elizabethkingia meningoseptica]MDE5475327.1 SusC/RagA family TonB-linked outer membrane protein [Elizabethkingia meningoseptica]MDE5478760.1 SusC/RagA family TonB-linked outer membrane protein [Elizabethkingia meningoseptica]MDE5486454.1 SusC/RagA family TonB-linked outer membrane protein [Elizabethkingia meningoseptica]MDE5501248.1 SusC/RagA 
MKKHVLQVSCLLAAFYFGADLQAQTKKNDTVTKEKVIEEVVMIGYGSRKKVDNTTSISSINSEEVTRTKVLNPTQAIQGKAAGVQVTASDMPGSTPTILIRGLGTVLGGRTPLYVVDGMFADNINNINANDILTYDILKDAAALAIYGNRAANGVIIITTKTGKGKLSVSYDGFVGVRTPLKEVKMADASEFARYNNIALGKNTFSDNQPTNTNWFDKITRTGLYNQHNLSISGSTESVKYFFSLNNYDEKSILRGTDYNRSTIRTNNEFKIAKGVTLSQNLSVAFTNMTPKPLGAFTTAYKQSPMVPVYFPTGQFGSPFIGPNGIVSEKGTSKFNDVGNPVSQLFYNNERNKNMLLQGGLKLDIDIVKGLKFTSQFNGEYSNYKGYNFENSLATWLAADPSRVASGYDKGSPLNKLTNTTRDYYNWALTNYLTFNKKFGVHDIEATIGTETAVKNGIDELIIVRKDMPVNGNYWNLSGTDYVNNILNLNSVRYNKNTTNSYFARAQYKLLNRYLLSATVRRDGSSQFADGHKWGTFPSFGAGWIISEESFMKNSGFNLLKLRGGWGRLGNQNVPLNSLPLTTGANYNYGFNGISVSNGITVNQGYDPNLTWEITEESSAGLDFGVLNNRLTGSIDVYNRLTKNIILNVVDPMASGKERTYPAHVGEVQNRGVELGLNWNDKIGQDFSYSIGANYSYNKNKLTKITRTDISQISGGSLGNGQWTKLFNGTTVGHALGSFYLWEFDGFDANGAMKYKDLNGNGVTGSADAGDRKYFDSYIPKSTLGVNLSMAYKNWDFAVNGYGAFGFKVYNGKKAQRITGENIEASVANNYWTSSNTGATNPAPASGIPIASTYFLESGNFFRINNITIGYTIKGVTENLKSIRLYVSAINPFVFQKYTGYSSEISGYNPSDNKLEGDPYKLAGVELDSYPTLRSFVFGLNINF